MKLTVTVSVLSIFPDLVSVLFVSFFKLFLVSVLFLSGLCLVSVLSLSCPWRSYLCSYFCVCPVCLMLQEILSLTVK